MPLTAPAVFIFPGAVLNVQHRIPFRSLFIIGRSIDVALQRGIGDLREEVHFPQVAVRHVFHRVEVRIVRGDFDAAAPTARSVEHQRSRIGDIYAIHVELVIVEAFILRVGNAGPPAVGVLGHRVADAADIEQHALRIRRPQTGAHAPLRIDLGILPELPVDHRVQLRGFEVFHRWSLIDFDRRLRPAAASPRLRRLRGRDQHRPVDENVLAEKVEVVIPLGGVVRVAIHMPDMRDAILLEILVHRLADANQTVLVAAAEPYQLQLFGNRRVRHQRRWRLPCVGRRREPADIGERLGVNQADVQRLAAAHRKAGQGAVVAIGIYGVVGIDVRDDVLEQVILERRQPGFHVHPAPAARPAPAGGPPAAPPRGAAGALRSATVLLELPSGKTITIG